MYGNLAHRIVTTGLVLAGIVFFVLTLRASSIQELQATGCWDYATKTSLSMCR